MRKSAVGMRRWSAGTRWGRQVSRGQRRPAVATTHLANLGSLPPKGGWALVGEPRHKAGSGSTATIFGELPH